MVDRKGEPMTIKHRVKQFALENPKLRKLCAYFYRFLQECEQATYAESIRARYDIHPTVYWSEGTMMLGDGSISIGERTYLGHNCHVSSHPAQARIVIGKCCAIAHSIHIRTTNYARVPDFKDAFDMPSDWGNITIGDYVWIGSHVYIGAGVTVGENSIIGANSVVTHDVEPNSVVGGVPARLIHYKSAYTARPPLIKEPRRKAN